MNKQLSSLRSGFIKVIPEQYLTLLTPKSLETLVSGTNKIDLEDFRKNTVFIYVSLRMENWFWKIFNEIFTDEERVLYLRFVWGRDTLPSSRIVSYTHRVIPLGKVSDSILPIGSTCFFTLKVPEYSSLKVFEAKLKYAIYNCSEIDNDFNNHDEWG